MKCGVVMHPTNFTDWDRIHRGNFNDSPETPDYAIWERAIRLVELADESRYDKVWTTEHHASPYGVIPNPLTFLAFVAGRTKRIGVGTQVIVVPWWHNPVRIAEEIGMVDVFLEGRDFAVGFGRGVAAREFDSMGIDRNESRGRFAEGIELVKVALTKEQFDFDGEFFKLRDVTVRPHTRSDIVSGMVGAFAGPDSLTAVAKAGIGMINIVGKPPEKIGQDVATFNGIRAELDLVPIQPIIQFICYCAETEKEALGAEQWFRNFETELDWHYKFSDASGFQGVKGYEMYLENAKQRAKHPFQRQDDLLFAGTPEMIIDRLRFVQKQTSAREFVVNFFLAGMPLEVAQKSMELFTKEVLPAVQSWDAPLHPHCISPVATA